MGRRYVLRWFARRPRCWVAVGAAVAATLLATTDDKTAWTFVVGVATGLLAVLAVRVMYVDDHPDLAALKAARAQAEVDAIVARYERERAAARRAEADSGGWF
jgi:hypothetical protein